LDFYRRVGGPVAEPDHEQALVELALGGCFGPQRRLGRGQVRVCVVVVGIYFPVQLVVGRNGDRQVCGAIRQPRLQGRSTC
jgi:hypothetical protein